MQTGEDILFTAPGPDPIPTATTEVVGTPGNGFNVYWIVSRFPIGDVVSGPFPQKDCPNILDFENYVHISWLPAPGALFYDLLVTKDLVFPKQPAQMLLTSFLTQTEFRDQGGALDFYDVAGIRLGAPQEEHIYFDNRDRKQPTLRFIPWPIEVSSIIFPDGSEQTSAATGSGQTPWLSDIDAASNSLFNVGQITGNFEAFLLTAPSFGTVWLGVEGQNTAFGVTFGQVISLVPININSDPFSPSLSINGSMDLQANPFGVFLFSSVADLFLQQGVSGRVVIGNVSTVNNKLEVGGDINASGVIRTGYGLFGANGLTINAGGNTLQLLFGASDNAIFSNGLMDVTTGLARFSGNFAIIGTSITLSNLPNVDQGAGSRRIWYDPADGNVVKFSP